MTRAEQTLTKHRRLLPRSFHQKCVLDMTKTFFFKSLENGKLLTEMYSLSHLLTYSVSHSPLIIHTSCPSEHLHLKQFTMSVLAFVATPVRVIYPSDAMTAFHTSEHKYCFPFCGHVFPVSVELPMCSAEAAVGHVALPDCLDRNTHTHTRVDFLLLHYTGFLHILTNGFP